MKPPPSNPLLALSFFRVMLGQTCVSFTRPSGLLNVVPVFLQHLTSFSEGMWKELLSACIYTYILSENAAISRVCFYVRATV